MNPAFQDGGCGEKSRHPFNEHPHHAPHRHPPVRPRRCRPGSPRDRRRRRHHPERTGQGPARDRHHGAVHRGRPRFIGGVSLAELGQTAFHLDISITDETNTKAEKARYLREIHAAFAGLLPRLHEVSYIHLIDARGAAYGYGGRSQEWRHQQAGV
ncbi:hypothetical protein AVKW3434_08680 [Acidovorax sp. SUPP3434]|nr:hypothetical protein AVKW3434_08680 [Acidovorax sp. SUPP3434]